MPIPTDADATYPDDPRRPGIKIHQQRHDLLAAAVNAWEGFGPEDFAPASGIAQASVTNLVSDLAAKATPAQIAAAIAALSGTYVPTNPVISGVVLDADGNWTSWTEAGVACSATYDPVTGNMATLTVGGVTRTFSYDANDNLIGAA